MTETKRSSFPFAGAVPGGLAAAAPKNKEVFYNDPTIAQMKGILAHAHEWDGVAGTFDTTVRFPAFHGKDPAREELIRQVGELGFNHGVYIQWSYRRLLDRKKFEGKAVDDELLDEDI